MDWLRLSSTIVSPSPVPVFHIFGKFVCNVGNCLHDIYSFPSSLFFVLYPLITFKCSL